MILIIGGAYQGKLAYALERTKFGGDDVFRCREDDPAVPAGKRIICGLDKWILAVLRAGGDISGLAREFARINPGAAVTCCDISCGIVPVDPEMRQWREAAGRTLAALSQTSDEVVRLFCGIPSRIK